MRIIGLTGFAGSGKDTVAEFIKEHAESEGLSVKRQGFADQLKLSYARTYFPDIELDEAVEFCNRVKQPGVRCLIVEDNAESDIPVGTVIANVTGRESEQHFGTQGHREVFGDLFWVNQVLPTNTFSSSLGTSDQTTRDDCDLLLIPDARFENEAQRILECGGEIWQVIRRNTGPAGAHISESGLPPEMISRTIDNDSTLDVLRERSLIAFFGGMVSDPA